MRFSTFLEGGLVLAVAGGAAAAPKKYNPASTAKTDAIAKDALAKLTEFVANNPNAGTCTIQTAAKRREWYVLPQQSILSTRTPVFWSPA